MIEFILNPFIELHLTGGIVADVLMVLLLVQWLLIFERFAILGFGSPAFGRLSQYISYLKQSSKQMDASSRMDVESLSNHYRDAIHNLVIVSPLLGLLGTVMGMIETFDSLAVGAMFSSDGGMALGISRALLTTQLGLLIAIPGHFMNKVLENRRRKVLASI